MATRIFVLPSPRVTATYTLISNDIAVLNFDLHQMQIGRFGDDLVFTHKNGGRIVLQNFMADPEAPKASFIIGDNAIAGDSLLMALGQELVPAAGPAVALGSHGHYEMSLSVLMDGITALGGLDLPQYANESAVEKLLFSGAAAQAGNVPPSEPPAQADNQPAVQSFAAMLTEDAAAHTVGGNVLLGAVLGDGAHALVWENAGSAARFGTITRTADGSFVYTLENSQSAVQSLSLGQSVQETFNYSYSDADGDKAMGTLVITIVGTNDNPVVQAGFGQIFEDSPSLQSILPIPVDVDVLDSVSFVPQAGSLGVYGSLTVQADGSYVYTLNNSLAAVQALGLGANLTETFSYTVVDSHGATATNVLTITINGTNDSPIIAASAGLVIEDGLSLQSILPIPVDVDALDSVSFVPQAGSLGVYGSLTLQANGTYVYNLNNSLAAVQALGLGANLTETFSYTVVDSHGATATNVLTITINGSNDSPTIAASAGVVIEDGLSLHSILPIPVDVDALDSVSFVPQAGSLGVYGSLTVQADGSYVYTLNNSLAAVQGLGLGANLTETFSYTVVDSHGATATNVLTITINGTNDSPTIAASAGVVIEDGPSLHSILPIPVDVDVLDSVSFVPQAGSLGVYGNLTVQTDGSYVYTLNNSLAVVQGLGLGANLTETFSYTVVDSHGATATNVLTITINGSNDNPTIAASAGLVIEDGLSLQSILPIPVDVDLLDSVSFVPQAGSLGVYGSLTVQADGSYTYSLNNSLAAVQALGLGASLTETFSYTVVDSHGATATNVLTITINGSNDSPTIAASAGVVIEDGLSLQSILPIPVDVDLLDTHSFVPQVGSLGVYGSLTVQANGSYVYTLNNSLAVVQGLGLGANLTETFSYTVVDSHGATATNVLTITINGTNDNPTIAASAGLVIEDGLSLHSILPIPVDVDALDSVSFVPQAGSLGVYGSLTVQANGSYTYSLNNSLAAVQRLGVGESLYDTFTYRVMDGKGGSESNRLVVQVQGTNDAPSVAATVNTVQEDTNLVATGTLAAITDVDNSIDGIVSNTLSYVPQVATAGQYGSLSLNSAGQYVYTLNNASGAVQGLTTGEHLTDVFIYTAVDGGGGSASNSLTITVAGTNDSPIAVATVNTAVEDRATVIEGLIVPQDVDNSTDNVVSDMLHCIPKSNERGLYGNLTLDADGHYVYVLNNSLAVVQGLGAGDTLAEVFFYTVLDSHGGINTNTLTLTVQGTNDAPLTSAFSNAVYEDHHNIVNGQLFASDPDNALGGSGTDVLSFTTKLDEAGRYGTLTLASDGSYIYTLNNSLGAVQGLSLGEKLYDQFQYTVTDNHGGVSTNTLTISVNGENDAPVALGARDSVHEDVDLVAIGTVPTPTDPDNALDGVISDVVRTIPMANVQGNYGTLSLDSAGHYVYTLDNTNKFVQNLDKDDMAEDIFPYLVADARGVVVGSTIRISILGTDEGGGTGGGLGSPLVTLQVTEDSTMQASVHIGLAVGAMGLLVGQYGSLSLQANGTTLYTLNNSLPAVQGLGAGESLRENFIVNVVAGVVGIVIPQIIAVQINGTNDVPIATTRSETLLEDVSTFVSNSVRPIHDADNTADGIISDMITVIPQTVLGHYGLFTISPNGSYTYILNSTEATVQMLNVGESVTEHFSYQAQDGNGGVSTSILNFTVHGSNDLPTVAESYASLVEGPRVSLAGHLPTPVDVDAHDVMLFVPQVVQGNYGQWVLNASGEYAYTLHRAVTEQLGAGESAVESFSYTVRDSQGGIGSNSLHITIYGRNDAPTVISASTSVSEDADLPVTGTLPLPVDVDSTDNPFFMVQNATEGQYGTLYISSNGVYTYVLHNSMPAVQAISQGESLIETLPYTVSDGKGGTATAYLNISVNGSNDLPTVAASVATVVEDIQSSFSDFLSTPADIDVHNVLSFVPLQNVMGMYGSLNVAVDGSFTYNLNSESALVQGLKPDEKVTDIFTYTVMVGHGGQAANTLMVHITGQNYAPIVGSLAVAGPVEDGQMLATGILPMPLDPDTNDTVSFVPLETVQGQYGVLTVQTNGQYVYTLQNNLTGVQALREGQTAVDQFNIMATDGQGASSAASLQIQIMGSNDGPIITGSGEGSMTEDSLALTGLLPAPLDVDAEDTVLFATQQTTVGQFGTLSVQNDGQYVYTLNTTLNVVQQLGVGDSLTDTFDYSVADGHGGKAFSTLTITIDGTNDAPHVVGSVDVVADESFSLTGVLPPPQDVDQHDIVNYVPQHDQHGLYGAWNIQADGNYTYTVDPSKVAVQNLQAGATLTESVTYSVQDAHGATASGTLSITIDGAGMQELMHPVAVGEFNLLNGDAADSLDFSALANMHDPTAFVTGIEMGTDLGAILTVDADNSLETVLAGSSFSSLDTASSINIASPTASASSLTSPTLDEESSTGGHTVASTDVQSAPTPALSTQNSAAVGTIHVESTESMQDSIQQELVKQSGG